MSTSFAQPVQPPRAPEAQTARTDRSRRTVELFADAGATDDEVRRRQLLDEVVLLHVDVATAIASRYRGRGLPQDDLCQVAYEGLVKAVARFDPGLGHDFMSFAVPTMRGEVQRHFRDQGWTVRPPRRIQELQARVHAVEETLSQELGREPLRDEVTAALDSPQDEVDEALQAYGAFTPVSLDRPLDDEEDRCLVDVMSTRDPQFAATEARLILVPLLDDLSPRDRRILYLRFCEGLTQAEIGAEIGVTQMQVSRLLSRILRNLRAELGRQ